MSNPDVRLKAAQWCFTLSTSGELERLAGLEANEVVCCGTHATCEDDTGNRYVQGYVKFKRRLRLPTVRRLIGNGIYTSCLRANDILMDIQLSSGFEEFGKDVRSEKFRQQLSDFKQLIDRGVTVHTLMRQFPETCIRNPHAVIKHVEKAAADRDSEPPSDPAAFEEWKNAGSPKGLAWKVYQGWKKGEVYQPSSEEWAKRSNALTKSVNPGPARRAFLEWCESRPIHG